MARVTEAGAEGRNRWLPAFILGLAALAGSLVGLGIAVMNALGDDDGSDPPAAVDGSPTALPERDEPLRAWIADGLTIDLDGLPEGTVVEAANETEADLVISAAGDGEQFIAGRYVPVAALHAGVEALTTAELVGLLNGSITDWSEVGGVAGEVTPALVEADAAWAAESLGTGAFSGATMFPSYGALLDAMTVDSGMVSVISLSRVNVAVTAVSLDGVDLVRGVGSAEGWPLTRTAHVWGVTEDGEDSAEALARTFEPALPVATKIIATGDVLINRCSLARVEATGDWGAALRTPVGEYLASADLTLGQYDGSIQDFAEVYRCEETTNLSSPPEVIESLTVGGFDGLSLATNHIADCGYEACGMDALLRTGELLEAAGITAYGAGNNLEEALAPAIFDVNGVSYGVLGIDDVAASFLEATADSPGTAPLDDSYADEIADGLYYTPFFGTADQLGLERFTRLIRELDAQVDVVVVQVETGTEDTHRPSDRSVKALRAAAEAGADIIIGNQAHHVQAAEIWDGVFVPYALGNFIYDQVHTPEHTQGFILETTVWGSKVVNVRLVPYQIEDMYRPEFATGDLRAKILADVWGAADDMVAEGR